MSGIIMKRIYICIILLCICKLYALSSDDFIIQQAIDNSNIRYRSKIYLRQIWEEAQLKDTILKTEYHEQWSGYKDVIIFYYENIEIVTAKVIPNVSYRWIVSIIITGKKYCTMSEITTGDLMANVISIYGIPNSELLYDGLTYSNYRINDPYSDYGNKEMPIRMYNISFIHKNNVIQKIQVSYIYNI